MNTRIRRAVGVSATTTLFFLFSSVASAVSLQMVSHQQTNNLGQLATLFWDGSDGRPASTAQWSWDGAILSSTGTLSTIAHIGDVPFGLTIIGDDVADLAVNTATMTVTATSYTCVEGTFLANVGANGCAQSGFGDNFVNETFVTYNVGGDASHVKRTVGGDDTLFDAGEPRGTKPRGLTTVAADPLGTWDAAYGAFDFFSVATSGLNFGETVLLSYGPTEAEINACRAASALGRPCDGEVGNGPDLRSSAWLEFNVVPIPAAAWLFGSALGLLGWMRRKAARDSTIALAFVISFATSAEVSAVTLPALLVDAKIEGAQGLGAAILSNSSATWEYNTDTGVVTGSGQYFAQYQISPTIPGQLFTHSIVDLVVGGGNAASATSYECIEGSFGSVAGGHLCGNISFGADFVFDSSVSYGPGTAFGRTIGGDDFSEGPQQNLGRYDGWVTDFDGSTIFLSRDFTPESGGFEMTFQIIPVPAAAWLFGSALGLLGWVSRRKA